MPDPTGESQNRPRADGEGREHADARRSRASTRPTSIYEEIVEGEHHAPRRDLQLARARQDRARPFGAQHRPERSCGPSAASSCTRAARRTPSTSISTAPVNAARREQRRRSMMFRDRRGSAPHNLVRHRRQPVRGKGGQPVPPPPLFAYRAAGAPITGVPARIVRRRLQGPAESAVTWTWDPTSRHGCDPQPVRHRPGHRARGARDRAAERRRACSCTTPAASRAAVEGSEAELTGTGDAVGVHRWPDDQGNVDARPTRRSRPSSLDAAGNAIQLTPGQTWVELPGRLRRDHASRRDV